MNNHDKDMPVGAVCKICPFWNSIEETGASAGTCRFDPPKVFPIMTDVVGRMQPQLAYQSVYPKTAMDEWCARHPMRDARNRADTFMRAMDFLKDDSPAFKEMMRKAGLVKSIEGEPGS